jgi:hypothetical protein
VAFAACPPSAAALGQGVAAQGVTAQASGSTEIVGGAVSAGVSFDVASRLLTSIFVTGGIGDTVSIFAPAPIAGVIAQGAWRDVAGISAGQTAALGDITILSRGAVSINVQQIRQSSGRSSDDPDTGVFVVLAQFN